MKLCCEFQEGLDTPVKLYQQGIDRFRVVYGLQIDSDLTYGEAAAKLGQCIMHSLACASKLDNRERDRAKKPRIGDRMACLHCDADIEYHGGKTGWIDRGGNKCCDSSGVNHPSRQTHKPYSEAS